MARNDGYGIDVSYVDGFFAEHNPARFSLSSVLHGQPPLDRLRRLSWVDLGCGVGLTACMVAAANPDIDVWGSDFNPVHIEQSRRFAQAAGLTNCTFDEVSFEDAAVDTTVGPAEVDVAVIHGIYSWVSKANIEWVAEFLRRRLRPGGLVFLSHNTAWGWPQLAPLAEVLRLQVDADGRRHDLAFGDAARTVLALEAGGAKHFPLGADEESRLRGLEAIDPRYGVHEYVVSHVRPVTFDEVAEVMAHTKCQFVGSNFTTDHLRHLWAPPPVAEIIDSTPDTTLQQMIRDLSVQRAFRRDLFRRGLAQMLPTDRRAWLDEITLIGLDRDFAPDDTVTIPSGSVTLDPSFYGPLVDALREHPLTVESIRRMFPDLTLDDITAALALLVDGGYAAPESPGWSENGSRESARRLNRVFVTDLHRGHDRGFVIAPAIGAAVEVETVELITLGALWDGAAQTVASLAHHVEQTLANIDWYVREHGEFIRDQVAARTIIEQRVAHTLSRISTRYTRLGIW